MKFLYNFYCIFLIVFVFHHSCPESNRWPNGVLTNFAWGNEQAIFLSADHGFVLEDFQKSNKKVLPLKTCTISSSQGQLIMNGIPLKQQGLIIYAQKGPLTISGTPYYGILYIKSHASGLVGALVGSHGSHQKNERFNYSWHTHQYDQLAQLFDTKKEQMAQSLEQVIAQSRYPSKKFEVKVLLDTWESNTKQWTFSSPEGLIIHDASNPQKRSIVSGKPMVITVRNNRLYVNGTRSPASTIHIKPIKSYLSFEGVEYHGAFLVSSNQDGVMCINCLDLEDYVCSVVRTESWPGWPLEVNKVFSIVSRSYVIAMLLEAQKGNRAYHVKNTNAHQTYQGMHNSRVIKEAVAQTKGIFLGYEGKPVLAMFDSCCGGVIPAHIADFNFDLAPYLARDYACTHCKRCKIYSWQASYDHDVFEHLMAQQALKLNKLRDIRVTKKDKAGLVDEVTLKGAKEFIKISGKKMYAMLKEIKSFCFSVRKKADKIIVKGRGFGHHLGLCQWGAREMVRDGWNYKQILAFYYPGTSFMRLT